MAIPQKAPASLHRVAIQNGETLPDWAALRAAEKIGLEIADASDAARSRVKKFLAVAKPPVNAIATRKWIDRLTKAHGSTLISAGSETHPKRSVTIISSLTTAAHISMCDTGLPALPRHWLALDMVSWMTGKNRYGVTGDAVLVIPPHAIQRLIQRGGLKSAEELAPLLKGLPPPAYLLRLPDLLEKQEVTLPLNRVWLRFDKLATLDNRPIVATVIDDAADAERERAQVDLQTLGNMALSAAFGIRQRSSE